MLAEVAVGVENGEEDESSAAYNGEKDWQNWQELLPLRCIWVEPSSMAKNSFSDKRKIEHDDGETAHRNEERLQFEGANIGDIPVCWSVPFEAQKIEQIERTAPVAQFP